MPLNQDAISKTIKTAIEDDNIPEIYVNGFVNTLGTSDTLVVLQKNGKPVAKINMSYTLAKTMAVKLTDMVAHLEGLSERTILTTDELDDLFSPEAGKAENNETK